MSSRKLTILFAPMHYVGAVNSNVGMAEVLRESGHRIVFAISHDWRVRLESMGFEVRVMGNTTVTAGQQSMDSMDSNAESAASNGILDDRTPLEKAQRVITKVLSDKITLVETENDPHYREIIKSVAPDVIITDHMMTVPAIVTSGIPWVFSWSNSPLSLDWVVDCPHVPPSALGLPINSDRKLWDKYRAIINECKAKSWPQYRDWMVGLGCPAPEPYQMWLPSPYATFYMTPKELDYTDRRPLPDTYHGFDCFKRSGADEPPFEVPDQLRERSGGLMYLSLGSMGSFNTELMARLVGILAKSRHRFIVSKGVHHDQYELPGVNMWGQRSVPQIRVLQTVDAVITHGGNNTFDNAQRVHELGYGVRLDPYQCSDRDLLDAVDRVLSDRGMSEKCRKASKRIQRDRMLKALSNLCAARFARSVVRPTNTLAAIGISGASEPSYSPDWPWPTAHGLIMLIVWNVTALTTMYTGLGMVMFGFSMWYGSAAYFKYKFNEITVDILSAIMAGNVRHVLAITHEHSYWERQVREADHWYRCLVFVIYFVGTVGLLLTLYGTYHE
ncbi:unnamed protein product, partial [Medioppia subpectinata]